MWGNDEPQAGYIEDAIIIVKKDIKKWEENIKKARCDIEFEIEKENKYKKVLLKAKRELELLESINIKEGKK